MSDAFVQHLDAWHEFYLVVGGAAAALTGLMFVVVSIGPALALSALLWFAQQRKS